MSDSFELGNPLIAGQSSTNKETPFKDTAFHIWTWKTPSMIVQHRYDIFPPGSGQPDSYIEYRLLNDSVVRENDRQQIAHNLNVYDAINVSLMLKLPWDISPREIKNWNYDSTVEVLCTSITNNDVATSRSVVKITGNARFYVPMENTEIEFKDIVIIPNELVAYKRKVSFDPPLIAFKADNLNTLREHYRYVIKRIQAMGKEVENGFTATQVQYSDGTILKSP